MNSLILLLFRLEVEFVPSLKKAMVEQFFWGDSLTIEEIKEEIIGDELIEACGKVNSHGAEIGLYFSPGDCLQGLKIRVVNYDLLRVFINEFALDSGSPYYQETDSFFGLLLLELSYPEEVLSLESIGKKISFLNDFLKKSPEIPCMNLQSNLTYILNFHNEILAILTEIQRQSESKAKMQMAQLTSTLLLMSLQGLQVNLNPLLSGRALDLFLNELVVSLTYLVNDLDASCSPEVVVRNCQSKYLMKSILRSIAGFYKGIYSFNFQGQPTAFGTKNISTIQNFLEEVELLLPSEGEVFEWKSEDFKKIILSGQEKLYKFIEPSCVEFEMSLFACGSLYKFQGSSFTWVDCNTAIQSVKKVEAMRGNALFLIAGLCGYLSVISDQNFFEKPNGISLSLVDGLRIVRTDLYKRMVTLTEAGR